MPAYILDAPDQTIALKNQARLSIVMNRDDIITAAVIAWLVMVFVMYHFQYIGLARTFLAVYAARYIPFLTPLIARFVS